MMSEDDERHRSFEEMAVSHVLGGLSEAEGRVFRAHLLECSSCRARVGELRTIASDLADVERDERRERAAKAVDTKRRAEEELDDPDEGQVRRLPRAVLAAIFVAAFALVSWNFLLRTNVANVTGKAEALEITSQVLADGSPLRLAGTIPEDGSKVVRGRGYVVAVLQQPDIGPTYAAFLMDANGQQVGQVATSAQTVDDIGGEARSARLFLLRSSTEAEEVRVVRLPEEGDFELSSLDPVLEAVIDR
jgi:anti-sigma factor RsiW